MDFQPVSQPLGLPISAKTPGSLEPTNVGTPSHSDSETYHDWGWFIYTTHWIMVIFLGDGLWKFMALGLPHGFFCWVCICWVTGFGPGFPPVVAGTRMFDPTLLERVCWLVVTGTWIFFSPVGMMIQSDYLIYPNIIFFRGVETTKQSGFRSPFQFAKERRFPWGYSREDARQVEHHILQMAPWNKGSREQLLMINYAWIYKATDPVLFSKYCCPTEHVI